MQSFFTMKINHTILFAFFALFFFAGCRPSSSTYIRVEGAMLGTQMRVIADLKDCSSTELYSRIMAIDQEMKASMSIFDENSLLSRLNRGQTDSIDEHIRYNFELAGKIHRMSDGAYDITVKPLVEAWGFAGKHQLPDPNIDSLLEFVGYDKVSIEGNRLIKSDPRIQLDFNSIAKGYTVDLVAELVERLGAENYLVDIGGELRCKGVSQRGAGWRIGVETPFDGNMTDGKYLQKRIQMSEGGMATSGNYRRYYTTQTGEKVAHTIHPKTGRSALSKLLSVTVISENCAQADALGTMFLAMGAEQAMEKVKTMPQAKVYFIFAGDDEQAYKEYISPCMEQMIMK